MEWFKEWFDTLYYKILYQHRNDEEAQKFIFKLFHSLKLNKEDWILDLACGRGRHAKFIYQLGYKVYGLDLSYSSIQEAKIYENPNLQFAVQDMRTFCLPLQFQLILSLFTSFGYFDNPEDHWKVLHQIDAHLLPRGYFLLDFFHSEWVINHLIPLEKQMINEIQFEIEKSIEDKKIIKKITVVDNHNVYHFYERVCLFTPDELKSMLKKMGFHLIHEWGDYDLNDFQKESPRYILLARKSL